MMMTRQGSRLRRRELEKLRTDLQTFARCMLVEAPLGEKHAHDFCESGIRVVLAVHDGLTTRDASL